MTHFYLILRPISELFFIFLLFLTLISFIFSTSFAQLQSNIQPQNQPQTINSQPASLNSPNPPLTPQNPSITEGLFSEVSGILLEKGTKIPLSNINIFILPHKLKAVTDSFGAFHFKDVPLGGFSFVINVSGYKKLELEAVVTNESIHFTRNLYLEKLNYQSFETTVIGNKIKIDGSQKTLTQKEILAMPGANGDPVKAIQNLPGVNRVQSFSSQVIIQGSAAKDTSYDIDGHKIPLVFHFGGLSSVVMPEAIEQVDYLSAGFGAYYSRALGGIISLKTDKKQKLSRNQRGFFFIDTLKSGGLWEKQIDDSSSILIGGRMSYVGLILGKALDKNSNFNLTVAPEFSDLSIIHKKKLNETDELNTLFITSKDTLGFLFKKPYDEDPSLRGDFKNLTQFYRIIPQWSRKWSDESKVELSVGYGKDTIETVFGDNFFNLKSEVLSTRGDWTKKIDSKWVTQIGFDNLYRTSKVKTKIPKVSNEGGIINPIGSADTIDIDITGKLNDIGLYWKNDFSINEWSLLPALRWDRFQGTSESFITPKLEIKNKWSDSLELRTALGLYVQEPEPQELAEQFGNPDIKSPRAEHFAIGFDKDFREQTSNGWVWNATFFNRKFTKLVTQSSTTVLRNGVLTLENYNNSGSGKAYGVESLLKYQEQDWSGWIAYTYSRSTRVFPPRDETIFEFDQTHNLNLIITKTLPNNWVIATRFRYTTGSPYTPIHSGVMDSDSDVYLPIRGSLYSVRQDNFSQLDIRIDKKWISDEQIWTLYFDIQNILNQKNTETIQYSYNYKQKGDVSGLPILPSLGLKGEF